MHNAACKTIRDCILRRAGRIYREPNIARLYRGVHSTLLRPHRRKNCETEETKWKTKWFIYTQTHHTHTHTIYMNDGFPCYSAALNFSPWQQHRITWITENKIKKKKHRKDLNRVWTEKPTKRAHIIMKVNSHAENLCIHSSLQFCLSFSFIVVVVVSPVSSFFFFFRLLVLCPGVCDPRIVRSFQIFPKQFNSHKKKRTHSFARNHWFAWATHRAQFY